MATFSVLVLTAPPPGLSSEAGGAFVKIDGRESLLRSVELFLNRDNIKQIHLAITPDQMEESKQKFGAHLGFSGVKLIGAGPKWMDQIAASVATLNADVSHVIVHDAARPAVPFSDIDALMESAATHPVVALSTPVRTGLVEVDDGESPVTLHTPSNFRHLLTPIAYSRAAFLELATKRSDLHPSRMTLIKGLALNVRVGSPADAPLVKAMIGMLPKPKLKAGLSPFDEAQW